MVLGDGVVHVASGELPTTVEFPVWVIIPGTYRSRGGVENNLGIFSGSWMDSLEKFQEPLVVTSLTMRSLSSIIRVPGRNFVIPCKILSLT